MLCSGEAYAHQDFWITKTFGRVKVKIHTGFQYEEINKAWIIGEYTQELCKVLRYKDTIMLDFIHTYTDYLPPFHFISYDRGPMTKYGYKNETEYLLEKEALVIWEFSKKFNPENTLKLVEYAITHLAFVKTSGNQIEYKDSPLRCSINSIDTISIKEILALPSSQAVLKTLHKKILRPSGVHHGNSIVSYYYQDNKYHIYYGSPDGKTRILLVTEDIYQFSELSHYDILIFTTDSTFHFIRALYSEKVSKEMKIEDKGDYYRPFETILLTPYKAAISFMIPAKEGQLSPQHRTILYRSDTDDLIQDLDALIDNVKKRK